MVKPKGWRGNSRGHAIAARKGRKARHVKAHKSGRGYTKPTQIGVSVTVVDRRFQAKKPGKRRSKHGKTYYEYRRSRSDIGKRL